MKNREKLIYCITREWRAIGEEVLRFACRETRTPLEFDWYNCSDGQGTVERREMQRSGGEGMTNKRRKVRKKKQDAGYRRGPVVMEIRQIMFFKRPVMMKEVP